MDDHPILIFTALLIFVYGLFSKLSERSVITGPMIFMVIGILVSPMVLGLFELHVKASAVKLLAEVTLVLILFVDATQIKLDDIKQSKKKIAARLLGIGLPLTMLLGTLIAVPLFDSLSLWAIVLMALILSPTDAALGQAVIKSPQVPEDIRRAISIESGLNDGIALPPILLCIAALAVAQGIDEHMDGGWGTFMLKQLIIGPLVGILIGWLGGRAIEYFSKIDWMDPLFHRLAVASLAILAFVFAELAHGNGFIAAFCGGLFLGVKSENIRETMQEFGEAEGLQLSLFVFLIFGMTAIPIASQIWSLNHLLYALLSLTVIRMLPVFISLTGTGMDLKTKFFIGWFGPRGIASVLYLLIVIDELGVKGSETIISIIVLTIMLSVILHGLTAVPFTKVLAEKIDNN
ncbi:MAG: sodium:proton antiporter [Methylophaga sp.]|nr:sodium:proton antiporter [Methylophaga sp.]